MIELFGGVTQRDSVEVRGDADDVLAIEALNQSRHASRFEFRNMVELRFRAPAEHYRETSQRRQALHPVLGQLHLELKCISRIWIAPVVRLGEAGGRCCGDNRTDDIRHREPKLAGTFAVNVDIERWVIIFLAELQIAEEVQVSQSG